MAEANNEAHGTTPLMYPTNGSSGNGRKESNRLRRQGERNARNVPLNPETVPEPSERSGTYAEYSPMNSEGPPTSDSEGRFPQDASSHGHYNSETENHPDDYSGMLRGQRYASDSSYLNGMDDPSARSLSQAPGGDGDMRGRPGGAPTLLQEAEECLAQSNLIFLMADLRLLSATGRVFTKFETISVDSDDVRRNNAADLSGADGSPNRQLPPCRGMSPAQIMAVLLIELRKEVKAAKERHKLATEEQRLMEGEVLEDEARMNAGPTMLDQFRLQRSDSDDFAPGPPVCTSLHEPGTDSLLSTWINPSGRKKYESDMHLSLKAYSEMIGSDLCNSVPNVTHKELIQKMKHYYAKEARKEKQERAVAEQEEGGTTDPDSEPSKPSPSRRIRRGLSKKFAKGKKEEATQNAASATVGDMTRIEEGDDTEEHHHAEGNKRSFRFRGRSKKGRSFEDEEKEEVEEDGHSYGDDSHFDEDEELSGRGEGDERSRRSRRSKSRKNRKSALVKNMQDRVDTFREKKSKTDDRANRQKLEAMVSDFFNVGTKSDTEFRRSLNAPMSEDELLDFMEKAVQSRIYGKISFMSSFFQEGSVSQLMAKSSSRVVWLNDWFPLKDLTYAISIDHEKKRVLVVFRGAITRADWGHIADFSFQKTPNPVEGEYDLRKESIKVHRGFFLYLFRRRKDIGFSKYDEIASKLEQYTRVIGPEYKVVVTGHSLGGALGTLFAFYASCEKRFTKNAAVKLLTFGSPYVGGYAFADAFRHQERTGKLMYARFHNTRDIVAHGPPNVIWSSRGAALQHVGIDVNLPRRQWFHSEMSFLYCKCLKGPQIDYRKTDGGWIRSYARALQQNFIFHAPLPWRIRTVHALDEHQTRIVHGQTYFRNPLLELSFEQLYDQIVLC